MLSFQPVMTRFIILLENSHGAFSFWWIYSTKVGRNLHFKIKFLVMGVGEFRKSYCSFRKWSVHSIYYQILYFSWQFTLNDLNWLETMSWLHIHQTLTWKQWFSVPILLMSHNRFASYFDNCKTGQKKICLLRRQNGRNLRSSTHTHVAYFSRFSIKKNKSTDTETSEKAQTSQDLRTDTNTLWFLFAQM